MKVNITYPAGGKKRFGREQFISATKWIFMFAAYICPIVNLATGKPAWSVIVLWSLYMVWTLAIDTSMVEYNRISQPVKLIDDACILLLLIDVLLSPGWAKDVVPIVCFSGLIVGGILFFTDIERQTKNVFPLLMLAFVSIIVSIVGIAIEKGTERWALAVMGALAFALIAGCFMTSGRRMLTELKKRFHTR